MTGWRIQLLGAPSVSYGGSAIPPFPTQRARDLFYYLVLRREGTHSRDVLVTEFCGDCPDRLARKRFRTTLWRMRSTVGGRVPGEGFRLRTTGGQLALDLGPDCWVDVEEFDSLLRRADALDRQDPEAVQALDRAIALYRGDLLEGVYPEWCAAAQRALKARLLSALEHRMKWAARDGDWPGAIDFARRLLAHDPLQEHVHRALMDFFYRNGDRPKAIQQYRVLEDHLDAELGVAPMSETRHLYDLIRADAVPARGPASA